MQKQYKIYEFDEKGDCYSGYRKIPVKVSKKTEKLAIQSQKLNQKHNDIVQLLFEEIQKDNPEIDFRDFIGDDFALFTGQVIN